MTTGCPPDDEVQRYVERGLDDDARARFEAHAAGCETCSRLLASLGAALLSGPDSRADSRADSRTGSARGKRAARFDAPFPESVGRYRLIEPIGSGAMGTVYRAHDPRLDRTLALKLLRPELGSAHAARMVREARIMARLDHPNVVAVHDAGELDERVFIAMSLVPGQSLTQWLAARPRRTREILDVFLEAADGLLAAHAAGVVHRDFKPDNVLVGHDGRVQVTDFGLARAEADPPSTSADPASPAPAPTPRDASAVVGTPAYMAPEQRAGTPTDARADTYAFCVSLWRALFDELPPISNAMARPPSSHSRTTSRRVPRRVRSALLRGLAPRPEDRPRLAELLPALRPASGRGLALSALPVLALVAGLALATSSPAPCDPLDRPLASLWSPSARSSLVDVVNRVAPPFAPTLGPTLLATLDAYVERWHASYHAACVATHLTGTQSTALLDQRMGCLEQRRRALVGLLDVLAHAPPEAFERAPEAAAKLPPIDECDDPAYLANPIEAPPQAARERVETSRQSLATARARLDLGDADGARPLADEALRVAVEARYRPLGAEALLVLGRAEARASPRQAAESFHRAIVEADASGHLALAAEGRIRLAATLGWHLGELEPAARMADYADAALQRLGRPPHLERQLERTRADLAFKSGRLDEAAARHGALASQVERESPDHPELADIQNQLAIDLAESGQLEAARAAFQRARAQRERLLGRDHPATIDTLANIAQLERLAGNTRLALDLNADVLARVERLHGADHFAMARFLQNRVLMFSDLGRYAEALEVGERALAISDARLGPDHVGALLLYQVVAEAAAGAGVPERARALAEAAVRIARANGPDHPELGRSLYIRGSVEERLDAIEAAAQAFALAIAAYESAGRAQDPAVAFPLDGAGRCAQLRGDRDGAVALHRRALGVREATLGPAHPFITDSLLGLGRALAGGSDAERAEARTALERGLAIAVRIAREDIADEFRQVLAELTEKDAP